MKVHTANRLVGLDEYYFSKKLEQIRQLEVKGFDVINLGIGSPDLPPHPAVIEVLQEASENPNNHAYQSYRGLPVLRESIQRFSEEQFHIKLDATKEILPLMGSKEGITHISLAFLDKGDQVLIPSLGYPTYTSVTKMVEAEPVYYPLAADRSWEPDWDFLERLETSKVKLLWINYPHMPTGSTGKEEIFERFVDFARRRQLLLCHDNPYSFVLNDSPQSIFQFDRDKEVSLELNSLSKSFNMAGWRVGWLSANSANIQSVLKVKSNMDSGMFKPIQLAAAKALELDQSWFQSLNATYKKRREIVFKFLDQLDLQYDDQNCSGMFVWAKVKEGLGEVFSDQILKEHHVFITPGFIFGEQGGDYVRVSLCTPEDRLKEALQRISQ